jgi:hypothetical protein
VRRRSITDAPGQRQGIGFGAAADRQQPPLPITIGAKIIQLKES